LRRSDRRGKSVRGAQEAAPREILPQRSGLEPYAADLDIVVGDDASSREGRMVEIRVALSQAAEAQGLLQRLGTLFERSSVSFDESRNEVRVRSEWESRSVVEVIDTVQSWLAADGVGSAELSVGDRSYTMVGPTLAPQSGRAAVAAGHAA
jgi:hypothetical protein